MSEQTKRFFLCLVVKETEIEKQLKEEKKILESIAEKTGIYTCIITVVTVLYIHVCMSYNDRRIQVLSMHSMYSKQKKNVVIT